MKRYLVEFIGTFFLVLTIVIVVNGKADSFQASVIIGTGLVGMIYAGGHISGAHYNPAVTLSFLMRGKIGINDAPMYVISQILGGITAAVIGALILGKGVIMGGTKSLPIDITAALMAETLGTFALCYVILNVATTRSNAGNSHYGIAIGFTVTAIAYTLGDFGTIGLFNPAVAISAALNGLVGWNIAGLAIIFNLIGGALAALVFKATYTSMEADD